MTNAFDDDEVQEHGRPMQRVIVCMADGCGLQATRLIDHDRRIGLCTYHACADSSSLWSAVTGQLNSSECKKLRGALTRLQDWLNSGKPSEIDGLRLIRAVQNAGIAYCLPKDALSRGELVDWNGNPFTEPPRAFLARISQLLVSEVLERARADNRNVVPGDWREIGARNAEKALAIIAGRGAELMKEAA